MKGATSEEILLRMAEATGSKRETNLAAWLGVTPQSVSNAKKKGSIPPAWVMDVALKTAVSLDWLYFGEGQMQRGESASPLTSAVGGLNKGILKNVIEVLEEFLNEEDNELSPEAKAEVITELYDLILEDESSLKQPFRMFKVIRGALASAG